MGLKHWILCKDHFKTHLFFSIFGWGDPSQLGFWSKKCVKPLKLSREAIWQVSDDPYHTEFVSGRVDHFYFFFFSSILGGRLRPPPPLTSTLIMVPINFWRNSDPFKKEHFSSSKIYWVRAFFVNLSNFQWYIITIIHKNF